MAREQSDREDLLREATALVERAELTATGFDEPLVIGFRRDGSASVYFGADPVYQFNTAWELRRAFVDGLLYKAAGGRLVSLTRQRSGDVVVMLRAELADDQATAFLDNLRARLRQLRAALASGSFALHDQVPADANVVARIRHWLVDLPPKIGVAQVPNVR
jgi:hypothetical protein